MRRMLAIATAAGLALGSLAAGENPPEPKPASHTAQPAGELADSMARRLSDEMHVKTVVGKPMTIGSVTLIPILMVELTFGGAGLALPGGPPAARPQAANAKAQTPAATPQTPAAQPPGPPVSGEASFMSGEARPLGFVVITKQGTRFISVAKTPAK